MTEADLEVILERGAWRLRAERALWAGLAAFGVGVVLASVLIFALRLFPIGPGAAGTDTPSRQAAEIGRLFGNWLSVPAGLAALALPLLSAAAALIVVFMRSHPLLETVALLLDARAGTAEHLVTWYQLRRVANAPTPYPLPTGEREGRPAPCPLPQGEGAELRRAFREAQSAATLALGARFDPRRLLPVRLPPWSRSLWLALLLLCCALLMPPRTRPGSVPGAAEFGGMHALNARRNGAGFDGAFPAGSHAPHVQVLNPSDLLVFQLKATDPLLPAAAKAEVLRELLKKIGAVPETELSPEVRELLDMLRSEVALKNGGGKNGEEGGKQDGKTNGKPNEGPVNPLAGAAEIPGFTERAMATVEQNFGDVREQLTKYYREIPNSKSEIRRKEQ